MDQLQKFIKLQGIYKLNRTIVHTNDVQNRSRFIDNEFTIHCALDNNL